MKQPVLKRQHRRRGATKDNFKCKIILNFQSRKDQITCYFDKINASEIAIMFYIHGLGVGKPCGVPIRLMASVIAL